MFLSDAPQALSDLLGPGSELRRTPAQRLPPDARDLWRAFGSTDEVVTADTVESSPFWKHVVVVRSAPTSQFDVLRDRAGAGLSLDEPVACLALTGREFHGHRGRPWTALEGNLHLSAAFRPRLPVRRIASALTMLPAVATADAVRTASRGNLTCGIKWVNDLLLGGRKVAGVLTATQIQGTTVDLVVLGVGLNVDRTPPLTPTPFVPSATSLREASPEAPTMAAVFRSLLHALAQRYRALAERGPQSLFEAYRDRSVVVGRAVRIWEEGLDETAPPASWPRPLARGVVRDLAPDLTLGVRGRGDRVARGRLALEDACRACGM